MNTYDFFYCVYGNKGKRSKLDIKTCRNLELTREKRGNGQIPVKAKLELQSHLYSAAITNERLKKYWSSIATRPISVSSYLVIRSYFEWRTSKLYKI